MDRPYFCVILLGCFNSVLTSTPNSVVWCCEFFSILYLQQFVERGEHGQSTAFSSFLFLVNKELATPESSGMRESLNS